MPDHSTDLADPLLPGFAPVPPAPGPVAPEARGRLGALATAYGVGTKSEENILGLQDYLAIDPSDRLLPMPSPVDSSWPAEEVHLIERLSARAAAVGENRLGNLWRRNLGRPKSSLCDVKALERMTVGMEWRAAAQGNALPPVGWTPHARLADVAAVSQTAHYPSDTLPEEVVEAVLAALNAVRRQIAAAGFADVGAINSDNAPRDIQAAACRYAQITGVTVRAINQAGHLAAVSRLGQTSHAPMTLNRRLALLNAALARLAEVVGVAPWTAETAGLLTPAVKAAWAAREDAEPTPAPFARSLFEWASIDHPDPEGLDDASLDRLIQHHPDLAYVEVLRSCRRRRQAARAARPAAS